MCGLIGKVMGSFNGGIASLIPLDSILKLNTPIKIGTSLNPLENFFKPLNGALLGAGTLDNGMKFSFSAGVFEYTDDNDSTSFVLEVPALFKQIDASGLLKAKITMGGGNDTVSEDFYSSTIHGGDGNDKISAGSGDDVINGGRGKDSLTGGAGKDTFVFDTKLAAAEVDTITDFNGAQDVIHLDNAIFKAIKGTGTLTAAQFVSNKTGTAADAADRIIYETDTGYLSYDADGNGSGAAVKFAQLKAGTALNNADFFVI